MFDRRHIFETETSKPKSVRSTLRRFWREFKGRHLSLLIVLALALFSTWTYVKTPDLVGQTVDCYLTPYAQQSISGMEHMGQASQSNCWYTDNTENLSRSETLAGVRGIIVLLVVLFVAGAVATGFQFYLMRWAGLHVLNNLRIKVFEHIHRLSLSYYAKNEAGDIMSRLTNDTETLQQAMVWRDCAN